MGSVVVRIILTGIMAIVPSAKDPNLTRVIAPKHMAITHDHPMIPEHYAFIEVPEKNWIPATDGRPPDFRYHHPVDADPNALRVVWIVNSEQISFANAPSNTQRVENNVAPKKGLLAPDEQEKESTRYALKMADLCPKCGPIANDYFDVAGHREKVAARMDLRGGRHEVQLLNTREQWAAEGTSIKQPFAQEVVFEFDVPACGQRLLLENAEGEESWIALHAPDGAPINVTVGNAPLLNIMLLDVDHKGVHTDDHFALFYDMFATPPQTRPILKLVPNPENVRGLHDNCVPLQLPAQDPS